MLPSAVTSTDVSGISGTPFLSHSNDGDGTPVGAEQRISARPPASTRTDVGGTENCFLMSEIKKKKKKLNFQVRWCCTSVASIYYRILSYNHTTTQVLEELCDALHFTTVTIHKLMIIKCKRRKHRWCNSIIYVASSISLFKASNYFDYLISILIEFNDRIVSVSILESNKISKV